MNFHEVKIAAACVVALLVGTSTNAATIPGLYNTDALMLPDGSVDPNYTVNGGTPFVYNHPAYLVDPNARFIAAQADGGYSVNPNIYDLTFSMAGLDPSTASLSGQFAADNYAAVYLNGNLLAQQAPATLYQYFQQLWPFAASSADFVSGTNTLEFVVTDTGPPSALLVTDLVGQASAVPEASVWTMILVGFFGVGLMLRRTRSSSGFATA